MSCWKRMHNFLIEEKNPVEEHQFDLRLNITCTIDIVRSTWPHIKLYCSTGITEIKWITDHKKITLFAADMAVHIS